MKLFKVSEHIYGHHQWVATPNDPATSRKGQNLYNFYIQTVIGTWKSSWEIERKRLEGMKIKSMWHPQNRLIWFMFNNFALPYIMFRYYGFWGAFYFIVIAAISILFLETVNYLEHYGLQRKEISPGVYEKVNFTHSWNAPHRCEIFLLQNKIII